MVFRCHIDRNVTDDGHYTAQQHRQPPAGLDSRCIYHPPPRGGTMGLPAWVLCIAIRSIDLRARCGQSPARKFAVARQATFALPRSHLGNAFTACGDARRSAPPRRPALPTRVVIVACAGVAAQGPPGGRAKRRMPIRWHSTEGAWWYPPWGPQASAGDGPAPGGTRCKR